MVAGSRDVELNVCVDGIIKKLRKMLFFCGKTNQTLFFPLIPSLIIAMTHQIRNNFLV